MYFKEVYRAVGRKNEKLFYEKINEDVEMNDMLVQSLERSGLGRVVPIDKGWALYYEAKKEVD